MVVIATEKGKDGSNGGGEAEKSLRNDEVEERAARGRWRCKIWWGLQMAGLGLGSDGEKTEMKMGVRRGKRKM